MYLIKKYIILIIFLLYSVNVFTVNFETGLYALAGLQYIILLIFKVIVLFISIICAIFTPILFTLLKFYFNLFNDFCIRNRNLLSLYRNLLLIQVNLPLFRLKDIKVLKR